MHWLSYALVCALHNHLVQRTIVLGLFHSANTDRLLIDLTSFKRLWAQYAYTALNFDPTLNPTIIVCQKFTVFYRLTL